MIDGDEWKKILGDEIYKGIDSVTCEQVKQQLFTELKKDDYKYLELLYEQEEPYYMGPFPEIDFEYFYRFFAGIAIGFSKRNGTVYGCGFGENDRWIVENVVKAIAKIPIRCLIKDIQNCKKKSLLVGDDKNEQYQDYERRFLKRPEYIRALCSQYPEMLRLIFLRIYQTVNEMETILYALAKDRQIITEKILNRNEFRKVQELTLGMSDVHTGGCTVAKLLLDNGEKLIYKPRSLEKEGIYADIYQYLCCRVGIGVHQRRIIDRMNYGWEEYIEPEECSSIDAVRRYFLRVGIQLFICYMLNASDIHGENLIAHGEYPELIDLEVMPGIIEGMHKIHTDEAAVKAFVFQSVMHTGILPGFAWKKGNEGAVLSALHSDESYKTPFKLPVVVHSKTSDIGLSYSYQTGHLESSLLRYQGTVIPVEEYVEEICEGFQNAYVSALENREELRKLFEQMFQMKGRYLVRHTQQYEMYSNVSLDPTFQSDTVDRIYLLHVLKNREIHDNTYARLFQYELESMMNLEVPVYYFAGNSDSLFSGDGKEYRDYFDLTAAEEFNEKWNRMDRTDLEHQLMFIRLSMLTLTSEVGVGFENEKQGMEKTKNQSTGITVQNIVDQISRLSIKYDNKKVWLSLRFYEKSWQIEPAGMYFYDGLAGLAVFFGGVSKSQGKDCADCCGELCRKLFSYTDQILNGKRKSESTKTGMFVGEGSLVYAYLLLYQLWQKEIFLKYAEKHAEIVMKFVGLDEEFDLLSGNAGWIVVLLELYKLSGNEMYLDYAVSVGDILWEKSIKQSCGYGWICSKQKKPLAGMAHGNSGFILAYASLLEHRRESRYTDRINKLIEYEDSLYYEAEKNWLDLRENNNGRAMNAWCHGGSGITLSRLKLYELPEFSQDERVKRDIMRGIRCLMEWKSEDRVCICHGLSGRYLIMKECNRILKCPGLEDEMKKIRKYIKQLERIPIQEMYNVGFMSGIAGIGIILSENW